MFVDRRDAGRRLGKLLKAYKGAVVLAIPKGGIEIGLEVAREIGGEFSVIIVRKLPFPDNPEAGFGAIAEDGTIFMYPGVKLPKEVINKIIKEQKREIEKRKKLFRPGPLPNLKGRTVIIVDDGIAMGSTMIAAIRMVKKLAKEVIAAAPVASPDAAYLIRKEAKLITIIEPWDFMAVAQYYKNWEDVSYEKAVALLHKKRI